MPAQQPAKRQQMSRLSHSTSGSPFLEKITICLPDTVLRRMLLFCSHSRPHKASTHRHQLESFAKLSWVVWQMIIFSWQQISRCNIREGK